ncbi:hypothetical protein ACWKT5_23960 [Streptomyces avermitilis]
MAQLVTEAERAAQRRLVGVVRTSGVLTGGGLAMWREYNAGEWKASAAELSQDLDTLTVPHEIVIAFRPPRAREVRRRKGQEVRVAFAELGKLVRWMPSLQQSIDELPSETPGFTFTYCEPRPTGMTMLALSSFAAEWPAWTAKQAEAMGLLCAECRFDLRTPGAERRLAYNIPTQPDRRRLVCGDCCGNGLSELERLAAAGQTP